MPKLLALLSSLKLAVILLVLLLLGLSAGTIIESRSGVEVAGRLVYYAPWFLALQALFTVNVVASLVSLFPYGKMRIGYFLTHASLVLILVGALVTYFFKVEGTLGLWEGQTGNEIDQVENGQLVARHALPFSVRLVDFQIDHYPGTMRPAQFRSYVVIVDPQTGAGTPGALWMNHPLEVAGYTIFQSSYQQENGREASVFSVSKDPGQPIVFAGYVLLVLGMCVVFGTRIVQRRRAAALLAGLAMLALARPAAAAPDEVTKADLDALRRLPVQHDGRLMPLDTWARENVWKITGRRQWQGRDAVAVAAGWLANPQAAANEPVIALDDAEVAAAIGLAGATHAALVQVARSPQFGQLLREASEKEARNEPRRGVLADVEKVYERAQRMGDLISVGVRPVPVGGPAEARWNPPPQPGLPGLLALARGPRLEGWPSAAAMDREVSYNATRPSRIAWIVLVAALAAAIAGWRTRNRKLDAAAAVLLVAGFGVMTWGLGTRWAVGGRVPASNMYESMLFLAWGVGLFALIALVFIRNRLVLVNASAGATLTMLLVDLLPMDGFIHPMPPVLTGTPWLAIHVPIIMVSYAVLALGVIIAHMQIAFGALAPKREDLIEKMADLNYWYTMVGSILLIAGILTGSIWAASSWGRYWGWDPKEVWSLVAFLAYMAILHGRSDRLLGRFGVAAWSIIAFQTILMTYLGVNYVLGTGLHAYGFGDSPIVIWMVLIALAEIAFLAWGGFAQRRAQGRPGLAG